MNAKQLLSAKGRNQLYYGDNLAVLRHKIPAESVDLCYIDPPFNSKRNYFQIYNNIGTEDKAQAQAFMDTWEWGEESLAGFTYLTAIEQLNSGKLTEQTVELIKGLRKILKEGALLAYLISMTLRIVEIHRVLKPTGSFYLHCDPTASHYLKLVCDTIFCGQGGDFLNEIIWHYNTGGKGKRTFLKKHDVIFWYSKSSAYVFNRDAISIERKIGTAHLRHGTDEEGREYYEDYSPRKSGRFYRWYLDNGLTPMDVWTDLQALNPAAKERLGYPTQKPEILLERIIKASSNEGDVVLDAYCGCGTTVAVAQRLNRKWIGIDITYHSVSLILKRMADSYPDDWALIEHDLFLDGVPRDMASAKALANRKDDKTRKEFEKWAVLTYSQNQARINEKKGADAGIDGEAFFLTGPNENAKAIW
jgi:DNA modification methylase